MMEGTVHVDQSLPHEWRSFDLGNRMLIAHDRAEGGVDCYLVSTVSRNVRLFAKADAALYKGMVCDCIYDEDYNSVTFQHDMAGKVDSHFLDAWFTEPAVRLKRLAGVGPEAIIEGGGA